MSNKNQEIRSRGFCYTLNNYTDQDYQILSQYKPSTVTYHVVGKETGDSGTPHLQGYIHFTDSKRQSTLINEFNTLLTHKRTHFEPARGSAEQNMIYCTKQGESVQLGTPPKQGKRTDILSIHAAVKKKIPIQEYDQQNSITPPLVST